jgi:TolA-binding protein
MWRKALPAIAMLGAVAAPAAAQRPPSAEQQIAILRQQLAASQASAVSLSQRLDAVERQLQQLVNLEEQNGHRVSVVESSVTELQSGQSARLDAIEQKLANLAAAPAEEASEEPAPVPQQRTATSKPKPQAATVPAKTPVQASENSETATADDPGEEAYSQGFHLWENGNYSAAIKSLQDFVKRYPNHQRASWARNLIGRALLDQGQPREAANVLLGNYRTDPAGGRAQDSLYYLGQSLMKLNQPTQACKAYAELESFYAGKVRPQLKDPLAQAKQDAGCS